MSSKEKKKLLVESYDILEEHMFYSRDLSFAQGISRMTKNQEREHDFKFSSWQGADGLLGMYRITGSLY